MRDSEEYEQLLITFSDEGSDETIVSVFKSFLQFFGLSISIDKGQAKELLHTGHYRFADHFWTVRSHNPLVLEFFIPWRMVNGVEKPPSLQQFVPYLKWITNLSPDARVTVGIPSHWFRKDLTSLFVFPQRDINRYGEDCLLSFPAYRNEKLPNGNILVWLQDPQSDYLSATKEDIEAFEEYLKRCEKKDE